MRRPKPLKNSNKKIDGSEKKEQSFSDYLTELKSLINKTNNETAIIETSTIEKLKADKDNETGTVEKLKADKDDGTISIDTIEIEKLKTAQDNETTVIKPIEFEKLKTDDIQKTEETSQIPENSVDTTEFSGTNEKIENNKINQKQKIIIKNQKKSVHINHRRRMKNKFLKVGVDAFSEHELLEMVLYYTYPRGDTNVKAHNLLNEYGSLSTLFYSPTSHLKKEISENFAFSLKFMMAVTSYIENQRNENIPQDNLADYLSKILSSLYRHVENEIVYALYMDNVNKLIGKEKIYTGTVHWSEIPIQKVLEGAYKYNSQNIILAHNHPYGQNAPSNKDIVTTKDVQKRLAGAKMVLSDHFIISTKGISSMRALGLIEDIEL